MGTTKTPEFVQLLTSSQSRIYAYILSLVLDPAQADDVLQKTNVVLWEKESEFELGTNFIAWAFRTAYLQVCAFRKQQQRERLVFDDEVLQELAQVASKMDETFETRQRLLRVCLEKLTDHQRGCIRLRYFAGSSFQAIAAETGKQVNAIKQVLFRARRALVDCVRAGMAKESTQ